jgi:hypothetical protein
VIELAEKQPVAKRQSLNFGPIITAQTTGLAPTKQGKVRREPVKKVAAHGAAPAIEQKSRSNYVERADAQVTRVAATGGSQGTLGARPAQCAMSQFVLRTLSPAPPPVDNLISPNDPSRFDSGDGTFQ